MQRIAFVGAVCALSFVCSSPRAATVVGNPRPTASLWCGSAAASDTAAVDLTWTFSASSGAVVYEETITSCVLAGDGCWVDAPESGWATLTISLEDPILFTCGTSLGSAPAQEILISPDGFGDITSTGTGVHIRILP